MHACARSAKQKHGYIYIYFLMKTFLKTGVYIYIYIYIYITVKNFSQANKGATKVFNKFV